MAQAGPGRLPVPGSENMILPARLGRLNGQLTVALLESGEGENRDRM